MVFRDYSRQRRMYAYHTCPKNCNFPLVTSKTGRWKERDREGDRENGKGKRDEREGTVRWRERK